MIKNEEVGLGEVYVLDGGNLLHKIPWAAGSITYGRCVCVCVCPVVVFDGCPEYSKKDECHLRRILLE